MREFQITEYHLKLIKNFRIAWNGFEYGAPTINPKRPYGNGDVADDIAKILGWEINEEITEQQYENAYRLHKETETALQICLSLQSFSTGNFVTTKEYDNTSWIKKIKH